MSNASLPAERPGRLDLVALILRLGLAVIFIVHGLDKVHPDNEWGMAWLDKLFERRPDIAYYGPQGDTLFQSVQGAIAWGELLGGIALALGLLTRIAAVGEMFIQAGAILTVTYGFGFGGARRAGYEHNVALILMCLAVCLLGGGRIALDRFLHRKATVAAAAPEHAVTT